MTSVPLQMQILPPPNFPGPTVWLTSVLGDERHLGPGRTLFCVPALDTGQGLLREAQGVVRSGGLES